jgi:hypothetical protein
VRKAGTWHPGTPSARPTSPVLAARNPPRANNDLWSWSISRCDVPLESPAADARLPGSPSCRTSCPRRPRPRPPRTSRQAGGDVPLPLHPGGGLLPPRLHSADERVGMQRPRASKGMCSASARFCGEMLESGGGGGRRPPPGCSGSGTSACREVRGGRGKLLRQTAPPRLVTIQPGRSSGGGVAGWWRTNRLGEGRVYSHAAKPRSRNARRCARSIKPTSHPSSTRSLMSVWIVTMAASGAGPQRAEGSPAGRLATGPAGLPGWPRTGRCGVARARRNLWSKRLNGGHILGHVLAVTVEHPPSDIRAISTDEDVRTHVGVVDRC